MCDVIPWRVNTGDKDPEVSDQIRGIYMHENYINVCLNQPTHIMVCFSTIKTYEIL